MKITLKNVRLSFPSVFRKAQFNGTETKYEATLLIDKDGQADQIKTVKDAIAAKLKNDLKGAKLGADKLCMKDGDEIDYDGYAGNWSVKASNNKRPMVINRDKTPVSEDDNVIYAGCYVNAIIELWAQNNNYGKRVNANLMAIQFVKEGEPFGDGGTTVSVDDFEDLVGGDFDPDEDPFA